MKKGILITTVLLLGLLTFSSRINAQNFPKHNTFTLPIPLETAYYLTGTPHTHYPHDTRAAIDLQITDDLGFIEKGAPLYTPFDGYAAVSTSENGSKMIEIINQDATAKIVLAHVMDDAQAAQDLLQTFPKHVMKGELIAYQGDSGYIRGGRFPVHVHFEAFVKKHGEFTNDNDVIDICSVLGIKQYCKYVDETGYVLFIN